MKELNLHFQKSIGKIQLIWDDGFIWSTRLPEWILVQSYKTSTDLFPPRDKLHVQNSFAIWSLTLLVQPKCIEVKKTANVHWATELGLINFVITPRTILKIGIAYGNEYRRVSSVGRNEAKICSERQIYSKRDANNHIFIHAAQWAQNSTQAKRQLSQREEAHWVFCRRFSLIYWETTSVFCEKRMLPFFPSLVRVWAFQSAPTVNAIRQIEEFFFVLA